VHSEYLLGDYANAVMAGKLGNLEGEYFAVHSTELSVEDFFGSIAQN
jgi:hypothetical protein